MMRRVPRRSFLLTTSAAGAAWLRPRFAAAGLLGDAIEPGYVQGRVVDASGRPIAGAKVYVDHAIFHNANITLTTGDDGRYRIRLPESSGVYKVTAELFKTFENQKLRLELAASSTDTVSAETGAARDFMWKLSGERPPEQDGCWGWDVHLWRDPDSPYDTENFWLTLEPVGPLIDGTSGKTIVGRGGVKTNQQIRDVPVGKYRVTGVYKPTDGPPRSIEVRQLDVDEPQAYGPSVDAIFLQDSGPTMRAMRIACRVKS
jgi:hypothetical protein